MSDLVEKLTELHIEVLKELLDGNSFNDIREKYADQMEETNYLEIMIDRAHRLTFDDKNKLIGAYPVCPLPTDHEVKVEGIGKGFAMCAIDALGMAYTFNAKTTINSKTTNNNEPFTLTIDPTEDKVQETEIVVTYQKLGHDNFQEMVAANAQLAVDACPMINFYASRDTVPEDASLEILEMDDAMQEAKAIFEPSAIASHIRASF